METLCYSLIAGYPLMGTAIAVLWRAYQKAQAALLEGKEQRVRELEALRDLLEKKVQP